MGKTPVKGILVRDCYIALNKIIRLSAKDQIEEEVNSEFVPNDIIIIGNPGIGKTYYGLFLMKLLIDTNQTFVYEPDSDSVIYLYHGEQWKTKTNYESGKIEIIERKHIGKFSQDSSVFHIIDGHEPQLKSPFRQILICSPRKPHYAKFYNKVLL